MQETPVLLGHFARRAGLASPALPDLKEDGPADDIEFGNGRRRERLWELSGHLHCSIIGTCLSTADLRQFFAKMKDPLAKTASEHEIHSLAVRGAGMRGLPGKLLHKMLDKRHEIYVRRFAKADTLEEVRTLWRACLDKGEVPGAYWAVMTHPLTDQALIREAFGDVHMLSHLVGMSNRADISRLRALERDLGARDEEIARQQQRLQDMARETARDRSALERALDQARAELRRLVEKEVLTPTAAGYDGEAVMALRQKLGDEKAYGAALAARLAEREEELARLSRTLEQSQLHAGHLEREVALLEGLLAQPVAPSVTDGAERPLAGHTLLYVGGLSRLTEHLRDLSARAGARFLAHDGGKQETTSLLPGLVSQADICLFPVDCISHLAASQVKRLCGEAGKPFVPLRSASLASFVAALADLAPSTWSPAP